MSSLGDLTGTLGAIAPQALAGYERGKARGAQFLLAQGQRSQQLQDLATYRQHLLEIQKTGQELKQRLADRAADQKDLGRLTDAILKDPHGLQQRGELSPTLLQWAGLYQKVHPGEPLPSFFGEQFVPEGDRTAVTQGGEIPLPPRPDVVQSWPEGTDAPPFPATPARLYRPQAAEPGVDALPAPTRPAGFVTAHVPAHVEGLPEIPLSEETQAKIAASEALTGYRAKRGQLTDEQIIRARVMLEPDLNQKLQQIGLLYARTQDIPQARQQAAERLGIMADALNVNKERLAEYIRNNFYGNQVAYAQFQSQDALRQAQVSHLTAETARIQQTASPEAWRELSPLFRGYFQTFSSPVGSGYGSDAEREPYRQAILDAYRRFGLDPRAFLKPGEPGYDPSFAGPSGGAGGANEGPAGAAGAATLSGGAAPGAAGAVPPAGVLPPTGAPVGRKTGQPAIRAEELPASGLEMRQRYPTYGGSFGPGDPGPTASGFYTPPGGVPALPRAAEAAQIDPYGQWHTDPGELRDVGEGSQAWQMGMLPSQPGFVTPPAMPKGQRFTGAELDRVNRSITDGSFPKRLRSPKARPQDRERLLRAYWLLRGRPYRGP